MKCNEVVKVVFELCTIQKVHEIHMTDDVFRLYFWQPNSEVYYV